MSGRKQGLTILKAHCQCPGAADSLRAPQCNAPVRWQPRSPSHRAVWPSHEAFGVVDFLPKLLYYLELQISPAHRGGVSCTHICFPRSLTRVAVNQHMKKEIQQNQQVCSNSFLKHFAVLPSLSQTLRLQFPSGKENVHLYFWLLKQLQFSRFCAVSIPCMILTNLPSLRCISFTSRSPVLQTFCSWSMAFFTG